MTVGTCCHTALVFSIMYLYIKNYFELCPFLFFIYSGVNKLDGMVHDTSIS